MQMSGLCEETGERESLMPTIIEEPSGPCQKCEKRVATQIMAGDGAVMAARGYFSWWCEPCALQAQISNAEKIAAKLPEWKARLAELL